MRTTADIVKDLKTRGENWDATYDVILLDVTVALVEALGNINKTLTLILQKRD